MIEMYEKGINIKLKKKGIKIMIIYFEVKYSYIPNIQ